MTWQGHCFAWIRGAAPKVSFSDNVHHHSFIAPKTPLPPPHPCFVLDATGGSESFFQRKCVSPQFHCPKHTPHHPLLLRLPPPLSITPKQWATAMKTSLILLLSLLLLLLLFWFRPLREPYVDSTRLDLLIQESSCDTFFIHFRLWGTGVIGQQHENLLIQDSSLWDFF